MRSTEEVLDHHLKCFGARDIDGLVADYAPDAVFFGPEGAFRGPNAIQPVFERLFVEFAKPGRAVTGKQRLIEGEYAHIVWSAETADNSYELGSDTFVIQKWKHSNASLHCEGDAEALILQEVRGRESGLPPERKRCWFSPQVSSLFDQVKRRKASFIYALYRVMFWNGEGNWAVTVLDSNQWRRDSLLA